MRIRRRGEIPPHLDRNVQGGPVNLHDDTHSDTARKRTRGTALSPALAQRSILYKAAARLLMDSLDYDATLAAVARLALPDAGSWSIVDLCEPSGGMRRLPIVHPDIEMQKLTRRLVDS